MRQLLPGRLVLVLLPTLAVLPVLLALLPAAGAAAARRTEGTADPAVSDTGRTAAQIIVRTEDGAAVPGAPVRVTRDGVSVADGTTRSDGTVTLPVPGPGDYVVSLATGHLPAAVAQLVPRLNPIRTTVNEGSPRTVAFRLEPPGGAAGRAGTAPEVNNRVAQLAVQGVRFGLLIALAAIGLSLVFGTTGLTNFAHGELITFGALTAYVLNVPVSFSILGLVEVTKPRVPLLLSATAALLLCALFGWAHDRLLWRPLRRRGTGLVAMMIVSIGLALFLRYLYLFFAGGSTLSYADYATQAGLDLGPVRQRPVDLVSMALAVTVLVTVGIGLLRTRWGTATRAVAANPTLAAASGIDVDRVIRLVWVAAAMLAGLAGILLGVGQGLNFQMGFQVLLLVFAAVTLGGLGTAFGALVGSLVVGVLIELSSLVVPTELKNVGALAVLIVILMVRPQGILGRAERVG